jgi:heme-degrading monooxygenase HmoA
MNAGREYVIVWEFRVRRERESEFVQKYGPEGAWAHFFRGSAGYHRTELLKDVAGADRYLTLDFWQTEEEFERFRSENRAEYERLDREFEGLTEEETRLGAFYRPDNLKVQAKS